MFPNACTSVQQNALYFNCSTAYFFEWIMLICYCDRASGGLQRLEILRNAFFGSGMGCNMALYQVPEGISWVWKRMIIDVFRIDSILTESSNQKKTHFLLRLKLFHVINQRIIHFALSMLDTISIIVIGPLVKTVGLLLIEPWRGPHPP